MIDICGRLDELAKRLPDIAPELVAEWNVAQWLNGELAPRKTAYYDVWCCKDFPDLTIQVKLSSLFDSKGSTAASRNHAPAWRWWQVDNMFPALPSFYVLCGMGDYQPRWFIVSRRVFLQHATRTQHSCRSVGALIVQSRSSSSSWIWRYHCAFPERNMISMIRNQMECEQLALI